jgi:hypothetical protein
MSHYLKDPQAQVNYRIDWGAHYLGEQLLMTSDWQVSPQEDGGLTIIDQGREDQRTSVAVSGGIAGHRYRLTNRVTLSSGESDERSISFQIEER